LTQDERDVVFSNIDDLLMCNTALLSDMESRQRDGAQVVDKIGDVFLGHVSFFLKKVVCMTEDLTLLLG
jgi:hypothetical protein